MKVIYKNLILNESQTFPAERSREFDILQAKEAIFLSVGHRKGELLFHTRIPVELLSKSTEEWWKAHDTRTRWVMIEMYVTIEQEWCCITLTIALVALALRGYTN